MISDGVASCVTSAAAIAVHGTSAIDKTDVSSVIPGSVDTSTRRRRASNLSMASTSSSRASINSCPKVKEDIIIDTSVNALVPNLLVRQVIDSLKNGCDLNTSSHDNKNQRMGALREAIANYQSNGSIQRHRGALLFVDISGFTTLSQNYPVEDFKTFINRYFTKIIDLIEAFGGEVIKFAGDALYATWACSTRIESSDEPHAVNIEKCTACAIAISTKCNNYKISKSYNTRRRSSIQSDGSNNSSFTSANLVQGEVLYKFEDKNAQYEHRGAVLNVYCGVSEGIMAGIDVVSSNRAEFFLVGTPLKGTKTKVLNGLEEYTDL